MSRFTVITRSDVGDDINTMDFLVYDRCSYMHDFNFKGDKNPKTQLKTKATGRTAGENIWHLNHYDGVCYHIPACYIYTYMFEIVSCFLYSSP